jgi:hypothetical protein
MTALIVAIAAWSGLYGRPEATARERQLFSGPVAAYLKQDGWTERSAYNLGHFLMLPLHGAFLYDEEEWLAQYESFFRRFVAADRASWVKNVLSRAQFLYLGTRYLVLLAQHGKTSDIEDELYDTLSGWLHETWTTAPAITWERPAFDGVKARLDFKMSLVNHKKSYFVAITDEEFYLFAEAADLLTYERLKGKRGRHSETWREMVGYAARVVREDSQWPDGGWLFQVGAWRDHPDLAYSAQRSIIPGMAKRSDPEVTMDTSHFHRFPLYLHSLIQGTPEGSADRKLFERARAGLAKQLVDVVLVKPTASFPNWRTKNYMNGSNNVYRYSSNASVGAGKGYDPYQLSGTFLMGWWTFLDDDRVRDVYADIAGRFPLPEEVLETYIGPAYSPPPRPAKSWYENGLAELFTNVASRWRP